MTAPEGRAQQFLFHAIVDRQWWRFEHVLTLDHAPLEDHLLR
jgi:hypothetical protein